MKALVSVCIRARDNTGTVHSVQCWSEVLFAHLFASPFSVSGLALGLEAEHVGHPWLEVVNGVGRT